MSPVPLLRTLPVPPALLVSLILGAALAGCVGEEEVLHAPIDPAAGPYDPLATHGAIRLNPANGRPIDFAPDAMVSAPRWSVGDSFGQHIFDDPSDTTGFHVASVVIAETGSSWTIATSSAELAKRDAYWDFPFLGEFTKQDLATTAYGLQWDFLFEFPLQDGKTWTRTITVPHRSFFWTETYTVTFTATYQPAIATFEGDFPGFRIVGESDDGTMFSYAYVPALGWYDDFVWFDTATDDPEDWRLRAMSMGTGKNWTGTYHQAEVMQRIEHLTLFCPFPDPGCVPTEPTITFTVPEGSDSLFGVMVAGAMAGTSEVVLRAPTGDTWTTEHTDTNPPTLDQEPDIASITTMYWFDHPAHAGEWRFAGAGAGVFWGAYLNAAEIRATTGDL